MLHIRLVGLQKSKHVTKVFIATAASQLHTKACNHITSLFTHFGHFRKGIQQRKAQKWLIVTYICDPRVKKKRVPKHVGGLLCDFVYTFVSNCCAAVGINIAKFSYCMEHGC